MNKYIEMGPMDPSYLYKVYTIKVDGRQVSKRIGIKKAMGTFKYYKYANFQSTVSLYNARTNKLVKEL